MAEEWIHNWMYSFLPATIPDTYFPSMQSDGLYLLGYCKNCRMAVTVLLNRDLKPGFAALTSVDVPRYGCVAPPGAN